MQRIFAISFLLCVNLISGGYIDERGYFRGTAIEESLRFAEIHIYRNQLFLAQERLLLCKTYLHHCLIDWEELRDDEGIVVEGFHELLRNMNERLTQELASVDKMIQSDPKTAKVVLPVNESSVEEFSNHFQGLIQCLEEQKTSKCAPQFELMITELKRANEEMIDTFHNVTTSIAHMKRKYINV